MTSEAPAAATAEKKTLIDGNPRGRVYEALALHEAAQRKRDADARAAAVTGEGTAITTPAPVAEDIGEIAVIQDTGDLILPLNPYDVRSTGLRFTRNGSSYTLSKIDGNFRTTLGNRVTLTDDDSSAGAIPFSFPFYGTAQATAFVNSDGNITFGEEDRSSTERNVARLLTGPPRVAPFFADLDPSTGTGRIFVNAASDQYTVTWCNVRGFDSTRTVTAQATLFPDGSVEMKYSDAINIGDSVVGISPGHTAEVALVDLSNGSGSGSGAIAERFAQANSLDTFAVAKKFYASHPDNYDQILLWTDQPLIRDAFAYELTVANEVRGIGQDIYDLSSSLGSAGRVRSLVVMDWVGKYPEDPLTKFLGENNTVSVLGQEVGHRWLAYFEFRDHTGTRSDALLGRDQAHWSFFFDSDASVMEGNDIEDLGGGQFRTTDAVKRFSRLDQYAMGLISASSVPTFFYVQNPVSTKNAGDRAVSGSDLHRHAPRRADRRRGRDPWRAHSLRRHFLEGPSPGVYPGRLRRPHDRCGTGRQSGQNPPAVGDVLPAGNRRADDGEYPPALIVRLLVLLQEVRSSGGTRFSPGLLISCEGHARGAAISSQAWKWLRGPVVHKGRRSRGISGSPRPRGGDRRRRRSTSASAGRSAVISAGASAAYGPG